MRRVGRLLATLLCAGLLWAQPASAVLFFGSGAGAVWGMAKGAFKATPYDGDATGLANIDASFPLGGLGQLGPGTEGLTLPAYRAGVCYLWCRYDAYRIVGTPFESWPGGIRQFRVDSLGVRADSGMIAPRFGPASGSGFGGAIRVVDGVTFPATDVGVNAAIADCPSAGCTVFLPAQTITVNTPILYPAGKRVRLICAGRGATVLKRGSGTNYVISGTSTHLPGEWYRSLENVTLDGNGQNGTIDSLTDFTLFTMRDVTIRNGPQTGLKLTSFFDSHFENVYVEECGDATHPFVVLDATTNSSDTFNNCQFYNLHIEANNQDAIFLDLIGNGTNAVVGNYFYGLKVHGNASTGNPARPLIRLGTNATSNVFDGGEVSYGNGSSQVECSGTRNRFNAQLFGIAAAHPPARAFQFIGGPNSVFETHFINSNLYTTACIRFDSGANNCLVMGPFLASGGTSISDAATGTMLIYRDETSGQNIVTVGTATINTLADVPGNMTFGNGSIVRMKDTGGTARNLLRTFGTNLLKWYPLASGQATRFQNFADNATNFEIGDNGLSTALTFHADSVSTPGGLFVGGQRVNKILRASATLDFDLTAVTCQDLTITLAGAALNDEVVLGVPNGSVTSGVDYTAWVSAAGTVTVRACTFIAAQNPASGTFKVTVVQ